MKYFWSERPTREYLDASLYRIKNGKLYQMARLRIEHPGELEVTPYFWGQIAFDRSRKQLLKQATELSFEEVVEKLKDHPEILKLVLEDI